MLNIDSKILFDDLEKRKNLYNNYANIHKGEIVQVYKALAKEMQNIQNAIADYKKESLKNN